MRAPVARTLATCTLLALAVAPSAARAQARADRPFGRNLASVQPLGFATDVVSVEYERALRGPATIAVNVSYHGGDRSTIPLVGLYEEVYEGDDRMRRILDAKLRFYVAEIPFHGIAIVLHGGSWHERVERWEPTRVARYWRAVPQVGASVEWSQGGLTRGDFVMKLGAGARRLLGGHPDLARDLWPILHLSVGVVF